MQQRCESITEDLTLIYAHNLENNLAMDVLVRAVTIQAADNSGISVEQVVAIYTLVTATKEVQV